MSRDHKDDENRNVRLELKYCEHCGGLWVRERGAGAVYCEKCRAKVADLPPPKRKPGRVILPVGPHAVVNDYKVDRPEEESPNTEAIGGAA